MCVCVEVGSIASRQLLKQPTMCSFWLIKQVDRSIGPWDGILGSTCDSSQNQRTSRTNSIQSTEIADQINKYEKHQEIAK